MPIVWLAVGQAALNAGVGLAAKGLLGKAAKAGAGLFQGGGPIDKDLAGALAKAGEGFEAYFRVLYPDDGSLIEIVEQLVQREDFQQALGSLPYMPFATIDVDLVREVFVERRGTDDAGEDFDGAWRAAGKRFTQAAAKKEEVGRFVDLQHQARSEQREEVQVAAIEEIRSLVGEMNERQTSSPSRRSCFAHSPKSPGAPITSWAAERFRAKRSGNGWEPIWKGSPNGRALAVVVRSRTFCAWSISEPVYSSSWAAVRIRLST